METPISQNTPQAEYQNTPPRFIFHPVQTRLLKQILGVGGLLSKATFLKAPGGYGKTVLMSQLHKYLLESGEQCFWIGLTDRHAFPGLAVAALEDYLSSQTQPIHPTQELFRGASTLETRITHLINLLNRREGPITIFIDNVKNDPDGKFGDLLDSLVFHTRDDVRTIWSSTADTEFNLSRARLEGLIKEIKFEDLAFNSEEAQGLLGKDLTGQLGNDGVVTLTGRTEGWPAALRIAKIAFENSNQPVLELKALSGSNENIAELLGRLALRGFSGEFREFLLCLGFFNKFNLDLCLHAIGPDSATHLDTLIQHNILVIPLDRNKNQYRLHGLLRDYLLASAKKLLPGSRKNEVLQRASEWCANNTFWMDAIDYSLAINDFPAAGNILEKAAGFFVKTREGLEQFVTWIDQVRKANIEIGLESHFWYVWALVIQRRYEASRVQLEELSRQIKDTPVPLASNIEQRTAHLRICLDLFTDRRIEAMHHADALLNKKSVTDPFTLGAVGGIKALCLASSFRFSQAHQAMRVAETYLREAGSEYFKIWITLGYAIPGIFAGNFLQSHDDLLPTIRRTESQLGSDSKQLDILALLAAKCTVEMGRDPEAREWLTRGLRSVFNRAAQDSIDITSCGLDAAVKLWNGTDDQLISIVQIRDIAGNYPPRLATMLSCYVTQRLLRLGRVKDAQGEATRIGLIQGDGKISLSDTESFASPRCRETLAATAIDLMIATGDLRGASLLVNQEITAANTDGRIARLVELGLAKSMILMRRKSTVDAVQEVILAISRATHGHIVRPFRDWSILLNELVDKKKISLSSFTLLEERKFFKEICSSLPHDFSQPQQAALTHGGEPAVELTRREIQLLTMLEAGLANKQMIDEANISLGTIKWHLKNLYKKLGVTNRTAAIAKIRSQNYISRKTN